jgi:hypothetical protein
MSKAIPASPPITPPAMAPAGGEDEARGDEVAVAVGLEVSAEEGPYTT